MPRSRSLHIFAWVLLCEVAAQFLGWNFLAEDEPLQFKEFLTVSAIGAVGGFTYAWITWPHFSQQRKS